MTPDPRILDIARSYPDEAAHTPEDERLRYFTPDQQLAWAVRFAPHMVEPATVAAMRGQPT